MFPGFSQVSSFSLLTASKVQTPGNVDQNSRIGTRNLFLCFIYSLHACYSLWVVCVGVCVVFGGGGGGGSR